MSYILACEFACVLGVWCCVQGDTVDSLSQLVLYRKCLCVCEAYTEWCGWLFTLWVDDLLSYSVNVALWLSVIVEVYKK